MTKQPPITQDRLNQLVTLARTNANVDALYESVHSRSPVTFKPSDDNHWNSSTDAAGTEIGVAETAHPSESLAHELLHADLKLDGYSSYRGCCSFLPKPQLVVLHAVNDALDNELQHHRMFGKFTALGLSPKHFYSDADKNAYKVVRREVEKLPQTAPREVFFLKFLTVLAKGGMGEDKERTQLRNFIRVKAGDATWKSLEAIEAVINQWSTSQTLDPGPTIVEILQHFGGYDRTWIGRSEDFPGGGLFVGTSFTLEEQAAFVREMDK